MSFVRKMDFYANSQILDFPPEIIKSPAFSDSFRKMIAMTSVNYLNRSIVSSQ